MVFAYYVENGAISERIRGNLENQFALGKTKGRCSHSYSHPSRYYNAIKGRFQPMFCATNIVSSLIDNNVLTMCHGACHLLPLPKH